MSEKIYGEVKVRKNIYPKLAKAIVDKGNVHIVISQSKLSTTTKNILKEAKITTYENVESKEVDRLREVIRIEQEKKVIEKKESE